MRVAIFSDTHGNTIALDAVLADVERVGGVDTWWFMGDAADLGFDPVGSVQRIMKLSGLRAVRGNADRESTTHVHDLDGELVALVTSDRAAAQTVLTIQHNCFWTRGALTQAGEFAWLAALPLEARIELPDRTRVLLVHAAPGTDQGRGIRGEDSDDDVRGLLTEAGADLVIVGHTHVPLDRTIDGIRVWNPGSVSNPPTEETRAMWTLLDADATGYRLERHFAGYDIKEMLARLDVIHHPAAAHIQAFWAGK